MKGRWRKEGEGRWEGNVKNGRGRGDVPEDEEGKEREKSREEKVTMEKMKGETKGRGKLE